MLLSDTSPEQLLQQIPKDVESLTLIQGYDSGNKTIKFADLEAFPGLTMLALKGAHSLSSNFSKLICDIDKELPLKYLDLEKVLLKSSKKHSLKSGDEALKFTFEYVQNFGSNAHPLTVVRKVAPEKIIPYKQYKEQGISEPTPYFEGFLDLVLLRISGCDLNRISWQIFDGLHHLLVLILEDNNLKNIPDFAFYGVPNLRSLSLSKNHLLNLQITNLAGLLELEFLDLSYNNFSQLSELSLPPFPKLQLVNFRNNPISAVFPNTFEVLNTTDSIIIGSEDTLLSLLTDSFAGLNQLRKLTLNNLKIPVLKREILTGIPNLRELVLTGNIPELEYDAFVEVAMLEKLLLKSCNIHTISMDAFLELNKLKVLDLSKNQLETLAPGIFDDLSNLHELYLNHNKFTTLPREMFMTVHPKLLRLSDNPWHCSCEMSLWKPMVVNRIKQRAYKHCDSSLDKGLSCRSQPHMYKYIYENRVAPKCSTPRKFENWSVFHAMRKGFKCPDFKPKYKKHAKSIESPSVDFETSANLDQTPKKALGRKTNLKIALLANEANQDFAANSINNRSKYKAISTPKKHFAHSKNNYDNNI